MDLEAFSIPVDIVAIIATILLSAVIISEEQMKTRYLLAFVLVTTIILSACDYSLPGEVTLPALAAEPTPTETPVPTPALFDYTQVSCEEKPLYAWAQPGTYIMLLTGSLEVFYSYIKTEQDTQPIVPFAHGCSLIGDFGNMLSDIPSNGDSMEWSGGCQSEYSSTQAQNVSIQVIGWEDVTTRLGTLRAMRVNATNTYFVENGLEDIIRSSEWFVCGYGVVYQEFLNLLDATSRNTWELLSYTPLTTDEARVRYILADIQLGGADGDYREHVDAEEVAEALRRWDAGITVTNSDQFERKIVGESWQVVYAGTETLINGSDVVLTTDPQP